MDIKSTIRVIEDYPKEGISFKDITTLLKNKEAYKETIDLMAEKLKDLDFDKLVEKIAEREKAFGKKETSHNSNIETLRVIEVEVGRIIGAGGAEIFREIDSRMINKEIFLIKQL